MIAIKLNDNNKTKNNKERNQKDVVRQVTNFLEEINKREEKTISLRIQIKINKRNLLRYLIHLGNKISQMHHHGFKHHGFLNNDFINFFYFEI